MTHRGPMTVPPTSQPRVAHPQPLDRATTALASIPGRLWWEASRGSVLGVVASILLAAGAIIGWFELVGRRDLDNLAGALNVLAEGLQLMTALWFARPLREAARGWGHSLGWSWPTMGDLRSGVLWALANLGVKVAVVIVLSPFVPAHIVKEGSNTSQLHHPGALALVLLGIGAVLVAPIAEETVFRGVLLRAGMQRWTFARSALLSSLIFGSFHSYEAASIAGAGVLVLNITAFGLVQCLAARRTGRLAPCAISHGLVNALALTLVATT